MRVLLDTHAFLWFVLDDPRLSAVAKAIIEARIDRELHGLQQRLPQAGR